MDLSLHLRAAARVETMAAAPPYSTARRCCRYA
jgi:hypothetical protein